MLIIRIAIASAVILDCVLAWASFSGGAAVGCGPDSGCDVVLQSRWGTWFGIPVGLTALLITIPMLWASLTLRKSKATKDSWLRPAILLCGAVTLCGAALWFIALQALVLKSFCRLCLGAHAAGLIAAASLFLHRNSVLGKDGKSAIQWPSFLASYPGLKLLNLGVAGLIVFVAGQLVYQPRTFVTRRIPPISASPGDTGKRAVAVPDASSMASSNSPAAPAAAAPEPRSLAILDGRIQLKLNEVPILGSQTAPRVMVSLFDYSCHHCRAMHSVLMEGLRTFSNQLAIVSLPVPLCRDCNPFVSKTQPAHRNACNYARIGLAVWLARPDALLAFDEWIFGPPEPPPVQEAVARASAMAGAEAFAKAMNNPALDNLLRQGISIYVTNYYVGKISSLPQVIVGGSVMAGSLQDKGQFFQLLDREFGLKREMNSANQP